MSGRSTRFAKLFGLPLFAVAGFMVAAVFAGVAISETTSTGTTTTITTTTTTTTTPGGEGCTPGFWKNAPKTHPLAFGTTGLAPSTTLASQGFNTAAGLTFATALSTGGGGVDALLRHAAAAYLNALSTSIDFAFTPGEVVSMTNAALANPAIVESTKNTLEAQNSLETPGFCD